MPLAMSGTHAAESFPQFRENVGRVFWNRAHNGTVAVHAGLSTAPQSAVNRLGSSYSHMTGRPGQHWDLKLLAH